MDRDEDAEDQEPRVAPGHMTEEMEPDDWSSFIIFVIGPDQVPFVVHAEIARFYCRAPDITALIAARQEVHLPETTPEHFNHFVKYMYRFTSVRYLDVAFGGTREQRTVNAWENMAHLMVLADRVGSDGLIDGIMDDEMDEYYFARALPGLEAIRLAYNLPDVELEAERSLSEFLWHIVQAWVQRAKYEDYMPLERDLPERFKMDLLKYKIGKRDDDLAEAAGGG